MFEVVGRSDKTAHVVAVAKSGAVGGGIAGNPRHGAKPHLHAIVAVETRGIGDRPTIRKNNIYQAELPQELLSLAKQAAEELPECPKDLSALRHLIRKRKDKARTYFDELAGKFGKSYVPGRSWKALAEALIKVMNYDVVADLGAA